MSDKMNFILLSLFLLFLSLEGNVIKLIRDFVKSRNVIVTLHTCWDKGEILQLAKAINENDKPTFISVDKNFEFSLLHNSLVIVDLNNCVSAWSFLSKVNQSSLFNFPPKYFLLLNNRKNIEVLLQNFTIYPSSEVFLAIQNASHYNLYQVYRINAISKPIWEKYGDWSPKLGLKEYLKKYPASQRRRNLNQQNIKVMFRIVDNDTWNHLEDLRYPRVDSFTKQIYGATKSLLDYCNVNAIYLGSEYFGYIDNRTGKFNGIIGALYNREVDLSGSSIYLTHARAEAVDFLVNQNPDYNRFVLKKPSLSYVKNIFILAFQRNVWILMVLVLTIFSVGFYFVLNVEAKDRQIGHKDKFSRSDVILISLEALCQQGTTTDPKRISGRIIALIIFMAFMFIYVAYSANIVAMLQSQVELKTIKELLESRLEVGAEENNYMRIYISQDTDEINQQLYKKKIKSHGFYEIEDGMIKLRNGFFAFHVNLGAAYDYILKTFTNYEICGLQEIEGYFRHLRGYATTQKKSPYKEIFKTGLLKVEEYGLRKRHYIRYLIKPICHAKGASFESVGIVETRMAFLLFIYGMLFSLFFLLIEKFTYYLQNKRNVYNSVN